MKINEAWTCYKEFTAILSDLVRKLAFAGIAVVWIFKGDSAANGSPLGLIPVSLVYVLTLFGLCLLLDFLQYVIASCAWRIFARRKETEFHKQGIPKDQDFGDMPRWWPILTEPFFYGKIAALAIGQILLIIFLVRRIGLL